MIDILALLTQTFEPAPPAPSIGLVLEWPPGLLGQFISETTGYNTFQWVTYGSEQYISSKHQSPSISTNKIIYLNVKALAKR